MLNDIEARLKTIDRVRRVEGAVELAAVMKAGAAPNLTPAVYVVPLKETPGRNNRMTGPALQQVVERIAIVTVIKKAGDRTGKGANEELVQVRKDIRDVLYDFSPDSYTPLLLGPSGLLSFESGVIWWQDEFITSTYREANRG